MKQTKWWKKAVVYQIYPRSFQDSNGDGIGDISGIISRLDYLSELGIDVIWLSPVYESPQDDNGYDISDYYAIMDEFGTLEDMRALITECKNHGISVMMDLVLNHSSDEHLWFIQSRSSKENPYRDYYYWADAKDGKEPNEQQAFFGGSTWEWDADTRQYYYHSFSKKQPDLNWNNPHVREELYQMIRFWMACGVEGFRLDAIDNIAKDSECRKDINGQKVHSFLHELHQNTFAHAEKMITVGETGDATLELARLYSDPARQELDMVFQFELMSIDGVRSGSWEPLDYTLYDLRKLMTKWQTELVQPAWNALFWSNHDYPRVVSRFGNDSPQYRELSAKMLATLLHGMKGTPYIYQGEELGMGNVQFTGIGDYRDIETLRFYARKKNEGWTEHKIMKYIYRNSRDNARTPMQWDRSRNAGFTNGTPWIPLNPEYKEINAATCLADADSIFYYYQKLIRLRKEKRVLVYGDYSLRYENHPHIFAYCRSLEGEAVLVICNFHDADTSLVLQEKLLQEQIWISNYGELCLSEEGTTLYLRPYEAVMVQIGEITI